MNRGVAGLDRLISAIIGLVLLAGGLLVIGWWADIAVVRTLFTHADPGWYARAPEQGWWSWALFVATVAGLVLGAWLLLANLRPNRAGDVELPVDGAVGTATVGATTLANAVATSLAEHPEIASTRGNATLENGVRTLRITLSAKPDVSLEHLRRLAEPTLADIERAVEGAPVAVRFYVEFLPVVSDR